MECHASLAHAHLLCPDVDPNEVRFGQLVALLVGLSTVLATRLLVLASTLL